MNKRDYYTFAELITALRKPYQENELLLKELTKDIKVFSKEPYNLKLRLELSDIYCRYNSYLSSKEVLLEVSKKSKGLLIRNIANKLPYDKKRYMKSHATFILSNKDGYYDFINQNPNTSSPEYYQPEVFIPTSLQEDFSKKYTELKKSSLYSLREIVKNINPFQTIKINGTGIFLELNENNIEKGIFYYQGEDDKIHIKLKEYYSILFIEKLLSTPIPYSVIPNEYLPFLNSRNTHVEEVFIEDNYLKRKDTLSITKEDPRLCLKRKKN